MKDKNKVKSEYSYTLKVNGFIESFDVIQEEGDRDAILVKLYQERWRRPEEYVEFLEKVIIVIKRDFIN